MSALIWGKERQPCEVHTPETLETAGLVECARELRERGVACEEHYIIGRHAYCVLVYNDGERSSPSRLF